MLEVTLPASALVLALFDHGTHLYLVTCELAPASVHQEAVGFVQEQVSPFVKVLHVPVSEVFIQVVLGKVYVPL